MEEHGLFVDHFTIHRALTHARKRSPSFVERRGLLGGEEAPTEGEHRAGMAAALLNARDVEILRDRGDDEETAAVLRQGIAGKTRGVEEARPLVKDVEDRRRPGPIDEDLDGTGRIPHDIPDQLPKDDLGGEDVFVLSSGLS